MKTLIFMTKLTDAFMFMKRVIKDKLLNKTL